MEEVDENWRVLYRTHVRNMSNKASDLDEPDTRLREKFDRINHLRD